MPAVMITYQGKYREFALILNKMKKATCLVSMWHQCCIECFYFIPSNSLVFNSQICSCAHVQRGETLPQSHEMTDVEFAINTVCTMSSFLFLYLMLGTHAKFGVSLCSL